MRQYFRREFQSPEPKAHTARRFQWLTDLLKHSFMSTFEAQQIDAKYKQTCVCNTPAELSGNWLYEEQLLVTKPWYTTASHKASKRHNRWMDAICPTSEHAVTPYFFKVHYPSIYC